MSKIYQKEYKDNITDEQEQEQEQKRREAIRQYQKNIYIEII